jgi:hypothetical protein
MLDDHPRQFLVGEAARVVDADAVILRRLAPAAAGLQPGDRIRDRLREPSVVALRKRNSATLAVALMWPVFSSSR